ncbi:MAG: hypothetical protein IJV06_01260 [Bacteroidaceae bacterium]|nr:hypothetical protein [Bacteroidaceae bacterium]
MEKLKSKIQSKLENTEAKFITNHFVAFGYLLITLLAFSALFNKVFGKKGRS